MATTQSTPPCSVSRDGQFRAPDPQVPHSGVVAGQARDIVSARPASRHWHLFFTNAALHAPDPARAVGYAHPRSFDVVAGMVRTLLRGTRSREILDVGCGHGIMSSWLTEDNRVYGIDFVTEMLRAAATRGIVPIQADAMQPPFPEKSFDVVMAVEIVQHMRDTASFILLLAQLLKDDGVLLVVAPSSHSLQRRLYQFLSGIGLVGGTGQLRPALQDPVLMANMLTRNGYVVQTAYTYFPFGRVVRDPSTSDRKRPWATDFAIIARRRSRTVRGSD